MALDAVHVQRLWDAANSLERNPDSWFPPELLRLREHQASAFLQIVNTRETAFEIKAIAINLNYAIRFRTSLESLSRLTVTVAQTPIEANSGPPSGQEQSSPRPPLFAVTSEANSTSRKD